MRHAAVLVDTDGDHRIVPLDDDVSTSAKCYAVPLCRLKLDIGFGVFPFEAHLMSLFSCCSLTAFVDMGVLKVELAFGSLNF